MGVRIDPGALTRAQGGWACTSACTSPTPFLFFLIGWLGGLVLPWIGVGVAWRLFGGPNPIQLQGLARMAGSATLLGGFDSCEWDGDAPGMAWPGLVLLAACGLLFGGVLDAVLQLLLIARSTLRALRIAATPVWPGSLRMWRPTSLLVEMDSPNLGLPCGWAESPLPRCPFFWT